MSFDPIANGWRKLLKNGGVGYTEPTKLLYSGDLSNGDVGSVYSEYEDKMVLEVGKEYQLTTDSGTFVATARTFTQDEITIVCVGNMGAFGGDNTGESCLALNYEGQKYENGEYKTAYKIEMVDFNGGSHMTISEAETVHTIDQKYLGGAVLPCVDIRTAPTSDPTFGDGVLTAEETAQVEKAVATGLPVIIRQIDDKDGIRAMVMMNTAGYMLQTNDGKDTFMIVNMEMMGGTGWVFGIQSTST